MPAIDFRPWETAPFFGLDGLPVIEALKRSWRELAEEYDRYHRIPDRDEKPYPLGIYQGDWRLTPFRSNQTERSYLPIEVQRAVIQASSWRPRSSHARPAHAREMDEAAIRLAFNERASQAMERNRARCPLLANILEPLYPHACASYSYSRMEPGVELALHRGRDSGIIRAHCCLHGADGCSLSVLNRRRGWKAGEVWAFDDALPHSAEHHGDRDRVVVIIDLEKKYVEAELKKLTPSQGAGDRGLGRLISRIRMQWLMARSPDGRRLVVERLQKRMPMLRIRTTA